MHNKLIKYRTRNEDWPTHLLIYNNHYCYCCNMWYYRYGLLFSRPSHSLIPIVVHNADSFAFIYTGFEISISEISAFIPKMDEFPFVQLKALKDLFFFFFSRNKTTRDNPQTLLQRVFSLKNTVFRRSCKIIRCVFSDSQRNTNKKNKHL